MEKKLYKTAYDKKIDGVCNGLAEYFNVDVTLVRVLFIAMFFVGFSLTFWIYVGCMIVMPTKYDR